jgi:APA family basic amino acid/polyamine antiporter
MNASETRSLPRVLSLWDIISLVVGGVIGSGIFLVPKDMAAAVGAPLLILAVWVAGGLLSMFGALSFGELGASMPEAGGAYVYLREAYGPVVSFLFGWTLFLVIDSGAVATLAVAFSSKYLPHFFPLTPALQHLIAVVFILFLVVMNYIGVRSGANLQNVLTAIKFIGLLGVCVAIFVFGKGSTANFIQSGGATPSGGMLGAFGVALVASLWAYKGWEAATYSGGEMKNPQRTLPWGILIGSVICVVLYLIAQLAYFYVMPAARIALSDRIAAEAMEIAVGGIGASIISFIILFSIMGAANQNFVCSPRVYYAMAKDGVLFDKLSAVHPKYLTPHVSILALGAWSIFLALFSGTFEQLFTYVVFGQWIFFGLTVGAVIVLRKKRPDLPRPYKTWGYPVTPAIFIIASLYIAVTALISQPLNALAGLGLILLGLPVYFLVKKGRSGN